MSLKQKSTLTAVLSSIAVVAAVLAAGAGLVGFKVWQFKQMAAQDAPPEAPISVTVAQALPVSFRQHSSSIGTLVAAESITLSSEIAGTVVKIDMLPGAIVETGSVLVQLDISLEAAQLESAKAAAMIARSRLTRTRDAFKSGAVTPLEMDEAEGQFLQSQAAIAQLEALINKKTLTAPFRARVGLFDTHEGQYLPSGTTITSLQSVNDYIYVDFALPQSVARSVAVNQTVSLISGTPFSGQTNFTATIEALDSRTDKQTRNLMVRARLQDAPEFFRPGDSVTVSVEYGAQVEAVAVPAEAVRRTPEGTQVFIAVKDDQGNMRAKQRAVQIIQSMGERVAVHAGVKVGETVVVAGSFKLMDRNLLQIVENAQLAPNSSASANTGDAVDTPNF